MGKLRMADRSAKTLKAFTNCMSKVTEISMTGFPHTTIYYLYLYFFFFAMVNYWSVGPDKLKSTEVFVLSMD